MSTRFFHGYALQFSCGGHKFLAQSHATSPARSPNLFPKGDAMPQTAQTPIQISVINACTVLQDSDIAPVVDALQQQVTNDFLPPWGVNAQLTFVPSGTQPPPGTWWLSILDDSDQAGALGYHDLTPDGLPLGKVFAGTDLKLGSSWSVTTSHELLEMLADPNINLTVLVQSDSQTAGTLYAYEVCDACEADNLGYQIGDVLVSDFVLPAWFESFRAPNSTQFDRQGQITAPLQLLQGGYIGAFDISAGSGWHQVTAEKTPASILIRGDVGSRRERRTIPRYQWLKSLPHKQIASNAAKYRERTQAVVGKRKAA
jgi:hypothetical protein